MTLRPISLVSLISMLFCGCPQNTEEVILSEKCNIHEDCEEGQFCVFGECKSQNITIPILSDAGLSSPVVESDSGEIQNPTVDSGVRISLQDSGNDIIVSDSGQQPETGSLDAGDHLNSEAFDASINNVDPIGLGETSDAGFVGSNDAGAGNGNVNTVFEYVENADFEIFELDAESGLNLPTGWNFESTSGETFMLVETTNEDLSHVMEIDRTLVGDHWAMMTQADKVNVGTCDRLILSGDVRPMQQGLQSPGGTQGQFPVHLRVLYNDSQGDLYTFQVGVYFNGSAIDSFMVTEANCVPELGNCLDIVAIKVPQNEWFSLPSIDLMGLTPKPEMIRSFHLGSSGTSFKAQFDNVQIYGTGPNSCGVKSASTANSVDAGAIGQP